MDVGGETTCFDDMFRRLGWLLGGRGDVGVETICMFQPLSKVPVVTKNEFGGRKIEITEGVAISTLSATHLLGLPYHGSPLSSSYPPTSTPILRNVAHIPRWGEGLEIW